MRLVHVRVPAEDQRRVFDRLESEGIDYVALSEGGDDGAAVVQFPVPTPAVEEVLDELNAGGLEDEYTVVNSAETVETRNFERLEDRFAEREDRDIAPAELRTRALEMGQRTVIYYSTTRLSATVAAAGLLLDAPAVVVGSVVIAPQVGAAPKSSVGTVFADREMIVDGLRAQALGLLLAVASAAAFGWAVRWLGVGPARLPSLALEQMHQRVSPGVPSVVVAIAAGFAAAFSLATAVPTSLVGVMIADAVIPAAAAAGIGIAWNVPSIAVGAAVLLAVNAAAINLTEVAGLWGLGYRPADDSRRDTSRTRELGSKRPAVAALVVTSLVLAAAGYLPVEHVAFERTATDEVEEVLSRPAYDRLTVVTVEAQFGRTPVTDDHGRVTVVVKRPAGTTYPDLEPTLQRRLTARTDRPIAVEVEFRDAVIVEADGGASQSPRAAVPHR